MLIDTLTKVYQIANKTKILETKFGKSLFRTAYFFYKQKVEDVFYPFIKKYPQFFKDGHILDVGANIGYTTVLFAKALSPDYKVFAIEPHPANFEKLLENIEHFGLKDVVVPIQAAVGEKLGEISLWQNETSHADHRILTDSLNDSLKSKEFQTIKVPMITLESLSEQYKLNGKIKFVKIDVQGYELPVLQGMKGLLEENSDLKICLEYAPEMMREMGFEPNLIFDFFSDYQTYLMSRSKLDEFDVKTQINDLKKEYVDFLFSKSKV